MKKVASGRPAPRTGPMGGLLVIQHEAFISMFGITYGPGRRPEVNSGKVLRVPETPASSSIFALSACRWPLESQASSISQY